METEQKQQREAPTAQPTVPAGEQRSFWRRAPVILLGTILLGIILFFGLSYLADGWSHESTDDAFLDTHIVTIAPRVAGQVQHVSVQDNQLVRKGDVLLELDPRDLESALEQKRANVKAAQANVELQNADLELSRAQVTTAEATAKQTAAEAAAVQATAERAEADLKRARELISNRTISSAEFDMAKAAAASAAASLAAAREKAAGDQAKVGEAQAQLTASQKGLERAQAQQRQAEAELATAELNLSYAHIPAPEGGTVTKKTVATGDYVQIGQALMALVPERLYVTANFKETQLSQIRTNQPAEMRIDAIAKRRFAGHVDSIQTGSGARFSLLPPENAVGNYVKVVQRVPVKIVFDEPLQAAQVLGPGMSVVPSIKVKETEISQAVIVLVAAVLALVGGAFWWRSSRRRSQ